MSAVPWQAPQLESHGDPHGQAVGGGVGARDQDPVADRCEVPVGGVS